MHHASCIKSSLHYFPAYEIVLDELRDYRFYGPDMYHPSPLAQRIVFERLRTWCFTPELQRLCDERLRQSRGQAHRTIVI